MNKSGGISFLGLLAILFIGLKLTGYVTWSWWLVLLPLYLPFVVVLAVFAIVALCVGLGSYLEGRK